MLRNYCGLCHKSYKTSFGYESHYTCLHDPASNLFFSASDSEDDLDGFDAPENPVAIAELGAVDSRFRPQSESPSAAEDEGSSQLDNLGCSGDQNGEGYAEPLKVWKVVDTVAACYDAVLQTDWRQTQQEVPGPSNCSWANKTTTMHHRSALAILRQLFACNNLTMQLTPKQEYDMNGNRIYNEAWTGDRWARIQNQIPNGAIILPIMVSSDETTLTNVPNHLKLHPLYLTLASIPREERTKDKNEAIIMSALLPQIPRASEKEAKHKEYLTAKRIFFADVIEAANKGIVMEGPGGRRYHVFPVLWSMSADYAKMVYTMNVITGWCTSCTVFSGDLGMSSCKLRENAVTPRTVEVMRLACKRKRKAPAEQFMGATVVEQYLRSKDARFLHELNMGVWIHLKRWTLEFITEFGATLDPLGLRDSCFLNTPRHNGMKHFTKGISSLSGLNGRDEGAMLRVIVGALFEFPMRANTQARRNVMQCVKSFINFYYLVSVPSMSEDNFEFIEQVLETFWEKKNVFRAYTSDRNEFSFPKMHGMIKYLACFRENGTPSNYTTEHFERQHKKDIKRRYTKSNCVNYVEQVLRSVCRRIALAEKKRQDVSGTPQP
ncbi:hypothetical protein DFJ77DRAFT_439105 [Powellomyces hirtus]|nr:hypothetical protein DFJ77DRAFT_439105 [Powellomyces hirtus]